jgi:UDP-glucose 4-epimerase
MSKVVVTGGSGWIGTAVCKELRKRRHQAIPFDKSTGDDVTNVQQVDEAVRGSDHVIHLAGVLGTHELFDRPGTAVDVNVQGSLNVIQACDLYDVGLTKVIIPFVNPSIYAATHRCAYDLSEAYRKSKRLRVSYVRPFNAFGPGQAYGDGHPQKIIPTFAVAAWEGKPLPVWGDGSLWVDLVHVDDIARMFVDAIPFDKGEQFDAGTGVAHSVKEIAETVIKMTGSDSKIKHLAPRDGEREVSTVDDVADSSTWGQLDWHPEFSWESLEETVLSYRP